MRMLDKKIIKKWEEEIVGYTNNETGEFVPIKYMIEKFSNNELTIKFIEDFMSKHTVIKVSEEDKKEIKRQKTIALARVAIKCPHCNEDLFTEECELATQSTSDLLTMDGIECLECNKHFEVDYVPVGVYEIEDYINDKSKEKDYKITHKPFNNIGDLQSHFCSVNNREIDKDDYIEILRVESSNEEQSYVVIFQATPNEYPKVNINSCIGYPTGLVVFEEGYDDISNYYSMEQIEEICIDECIRFRDYLEEMGDIYVK